MKTKVTEISISYKGSSKAIEFPKISSSQDAGELFFEHWNKKTIGLYESFQIMLLNNGNLVKGIFVASSGGITGTLVDVRIIFAVLLKSLSTAVILAHNHPSGTLKPSEADKSLTRKLVKAGELLDIKVLDHLIIAPDGKFFSFSDQGLM